MRGKCRKPIGSPIKSGGRAYDFFPERFYYLGGRFVKSKLFSVRVPANEIEAFELLCGCFPGASPALIMRALLLTSSRMGITNALAKHSSSKVRSPKK